MAEGKQLSYGCVWWFEKMTVTVEELCVQRKAAVCGERTEVLSGSEGEMTHLRGQLSLDILMLIRRFIPN